MGIENPVHLLFIAIVALIVLGPKRLPALARALGKGVREFREALGQGEASAERPEPTPAETVDPPQPVRSPDAPDRGPL
jgi:TatA/E family protein of Tat protein translocase